MSFFYLNFGGGDWDNVNVCFSRSPVSTQCPQKVHLSRGVGGCYRRQQAASGENGKKFPETLCRNLSKMAALGWKFAVIGDRGKLFRIFVAGADQAQSGQKYHTRMGELVISQNLVPTWPKHLYTKGSLT